MKDPDSKLEGLIGVSETYKRASWVMLAKDAGIAPDRLLWFILLVNNTKFRHNSENMS